MTIEELEEIELQLTGLVDRVGIENGAVWFQESFDPHDDEEPHDAAWRALLTLQEWLGEIGLKATDTDSDNDTLWGRVTKAGGV